jgi:hypothetical protein
MRDYILFMHSDTEETPPDELWGPYFTRLRDSGAFQGGSSIGSGEILKKDGSGGPILSQLAGYIRIRASDLDSARSLVRGNPVYECGGSVELRELPID